MALVPAGVAVAALNFSLAPTARLDLMVDQVRLTRLFTFAPMRRYGNWMWAVFSPPAILPVLTLLPCWRLRIGQRWEAQLI